MTNTIAPAAHGDMTSGDLVLFLGTVCQGGFRGFFTVMKRAHPHFTTPQILGPMLADLRHDPEMVQAIREVAAERRRELV